jgi:hypothetical protein
MQNAALRLHAQVIVYLKLISIGESHIARRERKSTELLHPDFCGDLKNFVESSQ